MPSETRSRPHRRSTRPRSAPSPARTSEHALQRRYQTTGDSSARDELVQRHLPLARALAARYRDRGEPVSDLTQVACIGLLRSVDRWDPERGTTFASFAVPTILGELRRHFRDRTWAIKPPRDVQELWLEVNRARDALFQDLRRTPTVRDIAAYLGVAVEEVNDALMAGSSRATDSLDDPLAPDHDGGLTVVDRVADSRDEHAATDAAVTVEQVSAALAPREREVLRLRYHDDLLQWQIAERIGCSQMHVSRILQHSMHTLQEYAEQL